MSTADPALFEPINGWILVRKVQPKVEARSGLVLVSLNEDGNISESMGIVERISPLPQRLKDGTLLYPADELSVGDTIVHRGFLRHANAVGVMLGGDKHDDFYLLLPSDVLGVVESGSGLRVGAHGEYEA